MLLKHRNSRVSDETIFSVPNLKQNIISFPLRRVLIHPFFYLKLSTLVLEASTVMVIYYPYYHVLSFIIIMIGPGVPGVD